MRQEGQRENKECIHNQKQNRCINYCDIFLLGKSEHIIYICKSKGTGWREGVGNGNCSLHKESLGCVNISQELEPKMILGPYTERREVL